MENTLKMMSLQGRPQSFIFGRQLQIIFANDGSDITLMLTRLQLSTLTCHPFQANASAMLSNKWI